MGFFNGLLRGLGFEGQTNPNKEIKVEKQNSAYENKGAEFDLKSMPEKKEQKQFVPLSETDVQNIVDVMKTGADVSVNLEKMGSKEYMRALDFMSGAIYVLGGKIRKIAEKTYLFCQNVD